MTNQQQAHIIVRSFIIHKLSFNDMKRAAVECGYPAWIITEYRDMGYIQSLRQQYKAGNL